LISNIIYKRARLISVKANHKNRHRIITTQITQINTTKHNIKQSTKTGFVA
jgi:hypothetical protein